MRTVQPDEVRTMLTEAAERFGLDFERYRDLARSGELVEPELRDLWLIWGPAVDSDVCESSHR
jgi:hypothetical protein